MGKKGWIIFVSIAVVLLGGLVYLSNQNKIDVSEFNEDAIITANEKNGNIGDNVMGSSDAKVVLIEYGDFQCPGCAAASSRISALVDKYGDHMAFVFRNLPLTSIHPNARVAASASQAAGLQGKYWEMNERLFAFQNEWGGASINDRGNIFRNYATALELDLDKFESDLASSQVSQKIAFDQAMFRTTGLQQSTPAFTLGGEQVSQEIWGDDQAFEDFIRQKLTEAGVKLAEDDTASETTEE